MALGNIDRPVPQPVDFSTMVGGINTASPPNRIGETDCEDILNMDFNSNTIMTRGGLSAPLSIYDEDLQSIFYAEDDRFFVVVTQQGSIYIDFADGRVPVFVGIISIMDNLPSVIGTALTFPMGHTTHIEGETLMVEDGIAEYTAEDEKITFKDGVTYRKKADICRYDNKTWIASGGKLQYILPIDKPIEIDPVQKELLIVPDTTGAIMYGETLILSKAMGNVTGHTLNLYNSFSGATKTIANSPDCDHVFERMGRLVVYKEGEDRLHYSAVGNPYEDGWEEDPDDDSSYKWIDIGYKADGNIVKVVPLVSDLLVFKSGGTVYGLSGEYPNWVVQEHAKHTDVVNSMSIENIRQKVIYVSTKGVFSVEPVELYGNFNFAEIGYKFNKTFSLSVSHPRTYNLYRNSKVLICPDTDNDPYSVWCFYWAIGAAVRMRFAYPVADIAETQDRIIVAAGKNMYEWSNAYYDDDGVPIESKIKTRKIMGNKIFTRKLDVSLSGNDGKISFTVGREKFTKNIKERRIIKHIRTNGREMQLQVESTSPYELNMLVLYYVDF